MKIVHIESGLGNQMLSYCEFLALKKSNPKDDIFIETSIYDIPECNDTICQWNGYELNRIFGIVAPNIKEIMTDKQWEDYLSSVRQSQFWKKNWNYPVYITAALKEQGITVENFRGNFEASSATLMTRESSTIKSRLGHTWGGYWLKKFLRKKNKKKILKEVNRQPLVFIKTQKSIFTGQRLAFKFIGNGIENIEKEIRESFIFPQITDEKNLKMLELIQVTNSVAIHARRGDMLGYNSDCYKYGYFKRAVKYIKKNVTNPVFIFFCDPGSVEWCKNNARIFGLNFKRDKVYFTDWNKGAESYRDMQLMSHCIHKIITNSSFGWWAAYLNTNPEKITCAPDFTINTNHYF